MSWTNTTLGDSCEMYQPQTITTKDLIPDGKYFVYGANGVIGKYHKYNHEEPQLLVTCRGATCGSVNVSSSYAWINGNAMVVKPKTKDISLNFLEYYFRGGVDLSKAITGAAQPQITRQSLNPIKLSYPSLATQQKIVSKLDAIFAEIDKATAAAEANAENADLLFQAHLDSAFRSDASDSTELSIRDLCKIGDGNHSSKYPKKSEMLEHGIPFIRSTNIVDGELSDSDLVYLSPDKHEELKKGHLRTGDVLITNRGEIGKVAIVDERFNNSNLNSQIAWLRPNGKLDSRYLYYYLKSARMKKFYSDTQSGAALQQLPIGKIEKITIPLLDIQKQLSRCIEFKDLEQKLRLAKQSYIAKIESLMSLKQSVLKQAFNGELVKE